MASKGDKMVQVYWEKFEWTHCNVLLHEVKPTVDKYRYTYIIARISANRRQNRYKSTMSTILFTEKTLKVFIEL